LYVSEHEAWYHRVVGDNKEFLAPEAGLKKA
jgi:hypothetical protein